MSIPAYIIDEIQKEEARRQQPGGEELQIEQDVPREITRPEPIVKDSPRGVAEIDFFL